jgi:hypothetical protein
MPLPVPRSFRLKARKEEIGSNLSALKANDDIWVEALHLSQKVLVDIGRAFINQCPV